MMALGAHCPESVDVTTPEERVFTLPVTDCGDGFCGVIKDAGDDPDATNGILVKARVVLHDAPGAIKFFAGEGVGTVTLPGLKVPVGEPAINPMPRKMIERAVHDVIGERGADVTVSAPAGTEIAKRTFNPRLGIVGGISILGTSGRVKPMDEASLLESLTLELSTHSAEGRDSVAVAFAGTGESALRKAYRIENRAVVQCGNYLGHILDEAPRLGFKRILIGGHPGKLLKAASGSFNTHNRVGGGGKEALCTQAAIAGAPADLVKRLYECTTSEEMMKTVRETGYDLLWNTLAQVTAKRCTERSFGDLEIAAAFIDNEGNILGETDNAPAFAEEIRNGK